MTAAPGPVVGGTDIHYVKPEREVLDRRLTAADRPGEHLWIVTAGWRIADPRAVRDGAVQLDAESLLMVAGPGCFKCEQEFSNRLARRPCRGSVDA